MPLELEKRDGRTLIGKAKGKCAYLMSRSRLIGRGGVWAVRCRIRPVKNRAHQLRIARYIPDHAAKGAAVIVLPQRLSPGL